MISTFAFELDPKQIKKVIDFHPDCKKLYPGASGGVGEYTFMPTNLGTVAKYTCRCGQTIDLTNYEDW